MSSNRNKRKKQFVDKGVQGAILLRFLAHWGLFVLTSALLLLFVEMVAGDARNAGRNLLGRYSPMALALLVLAPIFIRDLCKLTNRFAGPMVRLRRAMHDLAEGRPVTPIHFRERDFWKELALDFNRVVERVQSTPSAHGDDVRSLEMVGACTDENS